MEIRKKKKTPWGAEKQPRRGRPGSQSFSVKKEVKGAQKPRKGHGSKPRAQERGTKNVKEKFKAGLDIWLNGVKKGKKTRKSHSSIIVKREGKKVRRDLRKPSLEPRQ